MIPVAIALTVGLGPLLLGLAGALRARRAGGPDTRALAIFVSGIAFGFLLHRRAVRSSTLRLFIIWMAYHSLFQSLPQVPWGALNTGGDVGVAMDYLGLGPTAKVACALASMALIPPAALW